MISNPFQAARAAATDQDVATRRGDFVEPIPAEQVARPEAPAAAPARPMVIDGANRREKPRAGLAVEVGLKSEHNFYTGFSENISEGGLFVATDAIQPVGSTVEVSFSIPGMEEPVDVLAEVRWVRPPSASDPELPPGMGLKFMHLDWDVEDLIAEFVRARQPIFYVD